MSTQLTWIFTPRPNIVQRGSRLQEIHKARAGTLQKVTSPNLTQFANQLLLMNVTTFFWKGAKIFMIDTENGPLKPASLIVRFDGREKPRRLGGFCTKMALLYSKSEGCCQNCQISDGRPLPNGAGVFTSDIT